ncbi:MAG: alpha/beta hydrolase [Hyphomicrobium sp.]|nr:MAG: alpha/beta hydrolase [Hyphomicrobium sp.]PPD00797.1 MAG: alpha/beta hydrolase [Hyphomicrobium sp.]
MMNAMNFATDGRDWPNRNASRFIEAAGFQWHVQVFGQGPPLLLLHGTGASTHSWRQIAPYLADRFTLVIPDLPGHGFTSKPPAHAYTLPGMAMAVGQLMSSLGIAPNIVSGHSAGAAVAIRMSLDKILTPQVIVSVNGALLPFQGLAGHIFSPLAKLMCLNPFIPRLFAWRALDRMAVDRLLAGTGSITTPEDIELYGRLFSSPSHCAAALGMMARWDLDTLARDLPQLITPLCLIAAARDRAIPPSDAERVRALVKGSQVATLPDAGHLAHEEKPAAVADIIIASAIKNGITLPDARL